MEKEKIEIVSISKSGDIAFVNIKDKYFVVKNPFFSFEEVSKDFITAMTSLVHFVTIKETCETKSDVIDVMQYIYSKTNRETLSDKNIKEIINNYINGYRSNQKYLNWPIAKFFKLASFFML